MAWPFLAAVTGLVAVPLLLTLGLAFTEFDAVSAPRFTGLENLQRLASDPLFRTALWNSLIFVALAVPLRLLATLGATALFAGRRRGARTGRAFSYLPTVIPDVSFALVWLWLLNPLFGPLGTVFNVLEPWGARGALAVMSAFQIGEGFLIALAARHDVPRALYELAEIDGASPWWTFRNVTMPTLGPVLALIAARDIAFAMQANLVPAMVVTDGGPVYATTFLPLVTYENAFAFFRLGYAGAMTLVMYVVTVALVAVQLWIVRRWWRASVG